MIGYEGRQHLSGEPYNRRGNQPEGSMHEFFERLAKREGSLVVVYLSLVGASVLIATGIAAAMRL